jgi:hypothetical protein
MSSPEILHDREMINKVFKIIKQYPHDDFWIAPGNQFLFEEIVSMCDKAGYDLVLKERKL